MKNKIFTKSIRLLITALLMTAALVSRKDLSHKIMETLCIIWLAAHIWPFLQVFLKKTISRLKRLAKGPTVAGPQALVPPDDRPPEEPPAVPGTALSAPLSENEEAFMMQHIALRLSDKLKSAYPQATWQWVSPPSLSALLKVSTLRIRVDGMGQYTHADITFDRYGRLHIEPMAIGSFKPDSSKDAPAEELPDDPPDAVDVGIWYQLVGQKILDRIITELNAGGHSRLTIKENGDIIVIRQKKETILDTLESFPPKQYWDDLTGLLEEYQLTAKKQGDRIIVSWL